MPFGETESSMSLPSREDSAPPPKVSVRPTRVRSLELGILEAMIDPIEDDLDDRCDVGEPGPSWADLGGIGPSKSLLLRHPGFAKAVQIGGFGQRTGLGYPVRYGSFKKGYCRITTITAQPPRLSKFGGGVVGLAIKGVGRGELAVKNRYTRRGAARFFEPDDRLVDVRLQQMHGSQSGHSNGQCGDRED
jgi:hypothetical protein